MDVMIPSDNADYDTIYNYSDYYSEESLDKYGLCEKTHIKNFGRIFLPLFYSIVCILSILANLMLMYIFIKYKTLRKTFPLHMMVSDILFASTFPFWAMYAHSGWIFGDHGCKIITLIYMVSLYSSNLFVACMHLHRCTGGVFFLWSIRNLNCSLKTGIMCAVVWFVSFLASIPNICFAEAHDKEKTCMNNVGHSKAWKTFMRSEIILLGFCIPFIMMLLCTRNLFASLREKDPETVEEDLVWSEGVFTRLI
ncbi:atypical chemokine receptor 2 [Chanos chanos]|uniref:Atypical chemokine receptor 2 n=1 Tax=Chanos chanos TaxID=29144 RepID=A0A6J2VFE6_CHACN|nr:atypical chemokine receptor 2-like [Chanos chanos]